MTEEKKGYAAQGVRGILPQAHPRPLQSATSDPEPITAMSEIKRLHEMIGDLVEQVNCLENRLEPILVPVPANDLLKGESKCEAPSPIVDHLQEIQNRITGLCYTINSLRERVQA